MVDSIFLFSVLLFIGTSLGSWSKATIFIQSDFFTARAAVLYFLDIFLHDTCFLTEVSFLAWLRRLDFILFFFLWSFGKEVLLLVILWSLICFIWWRVSRNFSGPIGLDQLLWSSVFASFATCKRYLLFFNFQWMVKIVGCTVCEVVKAGRRIRSCQIKS